MKKVLNVGLIGCGWIANGKHLPTITKQDDLKIVALCDVIPQRANALIEKFNLSGVSVYEDYNDLTNRADIDIVYICTPNPLHFEMACAALENNKHIFVEKPLACTKKECDKIIEISKAKDKLVTVGFQRRFFPAHILAKKMVEAGELGEIYFAKAHGVRYRGTPGWGEYITGKNGGGVFIDGVPHSLDITLWLMDNYEPLSVKANTYNKMKGKVEGCMWGIPWKEEDFKVEDSGFALVTMKNGATIMMECAWAMNMISTDMKATICGTEAGIDMQGGPATTDYIRKNGVRLGSNFIEEITPVTGMGFNINEDANQQECRNFIDAIKTGSELLITAEQSMVVTQIIEGIYKSAASGKEVFFD